MKVSQNKTQPFFNPSINDFTDSFKNSFLSKEDILDRLYIGIKNFFGFGSVNLYFVNPITASIESTIPKTNSWPLPSSEKDWLLTQVHSKTNADRVIPFYTSTRQTQPYTDQAQLKKNQKEFNYACFDGLYLACLSESNALTCIIFIHNWHHKKLVAPKKDLIKVTLSLCEFVQNALWALDNFVIHQKIESLQHDKKTLTKRIQKDEEDLKRRILELSVLYDASNSLGYTLNYEQIIKLVLDSVNKVLHFDFCSILLLDFSPQPEIITTLNKAIPLAFIKGVQQNIISAIAPFIKRFIQFKDVSIKMKKNFPQQKGRPKNLPLKSYANVPLVFKEEVIGMLNICSTSKNVFTKNEMTFLHTMANQLSSQLGRIKITKELEKSKINSLIKSMSDGIIMLDMNHSLDTINPSAIKLLNLDDQSEPTTDTVLKQFATLNIQDAYHKVSHHQKPIIKDIQSHKKFLNMMILPVFEAGEKQVGTVLIFRDITEINKMNRIKAQRLEAISQVSLILRSIGDLNSLLSVLMEFILNIAKADVGSIQLRHNNRYTTRVHSNFPEKVLKSFRFKDGKTLASYVLENKALFYLENCHNNPLIEKDAKIVLDSFLCVPILVKNELIGLVNIARQIGNKNPALTADDIETLSTITALSGAAIHNALLYQETIKRQKLNQEIKVAKSIQDRLIPNSPPQIDKLAVETLFFPAREIGGDYYEFFQLPNDCVGIAIADIVGKGVPASIFMAMLKSILHAHILEICSPQKALNIINRILYNDPVINTFVPFYYAVFNTKTFELKYANAGHETALLISKDTVTSLDTDGLPLGSYLDATYSENSCKIKNNDVILLFTDGIVEATDKNGTAFGLKRLKSLAKKYAHFPVSRIVDTIQSTLFEHIQVGEQKDDITLVALKANKNHKAQQNDIPIEVKQFLVSSAKSNIRKIRNEIEIIAKKLGANKTDIYNLKLAINEAHANVIEHSYLGSDHGEILFKFFIYKKCIKVLIKDFNSAPKQQTLKSAAQLDSLEGSGLGVFLIKSVMDDVSYKYIPNVGSELLLTKYIKSL